MAVFPDIGREVSIELDDSHCPKTVQAIVASLPIEVSVNRWGDELYTEKTQISEVEEDGKRKVNLFDVAYWPEGKALCLFLGSTPISKPGEILAYSPVNIVGKIITDEGQKKDILDKIKTSTRVIFK